MITWFADIFPFQTTVVTLAIGILILKVDRERMRRSRLKSESTFSHYVGWIYVTLAVLFGVFGTTIFHLLNF